MDRKRKLTKNEQCRHGCAWCYDKECLEKEHPRTNILVHVKGKRIGGKYIKAHDVKRSDDHYCPYVECPYKDILDKYRSYNEYLIMLSTTNEDLIKFIKSRMIK